MPSTRTRTKPLRWASSKIFCVLAFAASHHRGQDLQPGALPHVHQLVDDLVDGLLTDFFAAFGTVGRADAGPQQAEIVVDLSDGAHRGPGILEVVFWSMEMAGDSPSMESTSGFSICPRNMPGIGGKGFHIPALAFGINGVKGQRAFARAGNAGDHSEGIPGDGHIHIFQIVHPGPFDDDFVDHIFPNQSPGG